MMKNFNIVGFLILSILGSSCTEYLDINTNVNQATSASPELVMPQALTTNATVISYYNIYGMQTGGYGANAGGYGGFNETVTYTYTSSNYAYLWPDSYDNLEDYQYVIDHSEDDPSYGYFNAAANIMKAYNFQLLVDAYNDVPYSEALKGPTSLTPKYDDAATIYADLADKLDAAIATIDATTALKEKGEPIQLMGASDVLFSGDMVAWKKLANTIKLRLIVRGSGKATFANTSFDATGFLDADALVDPGYRRDNNRQNPSWDYWAYTYTGAAANKSWIPTTYAMSFYDGSKLTDTGRGKAVFYQFPNTGTNQLGYQNNSVPSCPTGGFWYAGTNRDGTSAGDVGGPLKGPDAGFPVMTAAESYFLQSEAALRGIISGNVKELFENGIKASFNYLYQRADKSSIADSEADFSKYLSTNQSSYLVNLDKASTDQERTEAIITQKYIALNMIASHEGFNEYRRTGFPAVSGTSPRSTFASAVSQSTRPDRLPTRILYPASEASYNLENLPQGIGSYTSLIFWAK